jgi:hypothetical protein
MNADQCSTPQVAKQNATGIASASAIVNNMSLRDLVEVIQSNALVAEACAHVALMMSDCNTARRRRGQKDSYNARYEVVVTGRQVSSGYHQHVYTTTLLTGSDAGGSSMREKAA